jgi:hypothetical protein
MVAFRSTTHPVVTVDCPVCDRPLPRVLVDVDARADVEGVEGARRGQVLLLTVRAQELDAAWWGAARAEHPQCIPDDVGPMTWCDACEVWHRCMHCHDDPPRGHTCPRCGRSRVQGVPR